MNEQGLEKAFKRIGAEIRFGELDGWARQDFTLDVSRDGKAFLVNRRKGFDIDLMVLDVQPQERHLLLMSRREEPRGKNSGGVTVLKSKYLMGHDERHWFVSEVSDSVKNVRDAKQSLKPPEVAVHDSKLRRKDRHRRHNSQWLRQGEWFFIPVPGYSADPLLIHRNEPLQRNARSKPHMCDELFRIGGETVYVRSDYPNGINQDEYDKMPKDERERRAWQIMKRGATVYVRGKVRHADHATVTLPGWHRVHINREMNFGLGTVAFLD